MMSPRLCITLIVTLLLWLFPTLVIPATSPGVSGRLKALHDETEVLKGMQPESTEFRSNTGLSGPQDITKALGGEAGKELADFDLTGPSLDAQIEDVESRLKKRGRQLDARKKNIQKIQEKNLKYKELEKSLARDETNARTRMQEITENKIKNEGKLSSRLKSEMKQQRKVLVKANTMKQEIRQNRTAMQRAKNASQASKLRESIAINKSRLESLKQSKTRADMGSKSVSLIGVALAGLSADLEENALAKAEGRPPSKINKVINFTKNVSGLAAIEGAYTNISIAQMEAYVKTLEDYEDLGYDITDPYVQERAGRAAARAVVRNAVYEGAKLAPVVGDLINIQEGTEAAGQAYIASEEAGWTEANNEQVQFQTSLRAAMRAEARLKELEKSAAQTKILTAALTRLKMQLLELEEEAKADREQMSSAVQTLEAFNEQAAVLQNQETAAILAEENVDTIIERLKTIKGEADERADNIERVKSEHKSGELNAQGVATQAGFISDLLQQTVDDYSVLAQPLASIETLSRGAELSAKVPQAQATIQQTKGMIEKQSQLSVKLYALYKNQASTLDEVVRQHQQARTELNKFLDYVSKSKNLEDPHQDRIRAALDAGNNVVIDQTAIQQALSDARGLRNTSEMVTALAGLDKTPQAVDTVTLDAITRQAQSAWNRLSGPNLQAGESIMKAQGLLAELVALAGDAEPVEQKVVDKVYDEPDSPLRGKLFAGKNWLTLTTSEIVQSLENEHRNDKYLYNNFFGYKAFDFPPGTDKEYEYCRTVTDQFCPSYGELYRVLEQGENKSEWKGATPYWIAYKLRAANASFTSDFSPMPRLEDSYHVTGPVKTARENNEGYKITPITLSNADEALILETGVDKRWRRIVVHARSGPLYIWHNGELKCEIGSGKDGKADEKYELDYNEAVNPNQRTKILFDEDFRESCASWYRDEYKVQAELLEQLLVEVKPYLEKSNSTFYFKPFKVNIDLDSFDKKQSETKKFVEAGKVCSQDFRRRWGGPSGISYIENYSFSVTMKIPFNYAVNSWQKIMDQIDQSIEKRYQDHFKIKNPRHGVDVSIEGADFVRMARNQSLHESSKEYTTQDDLYFRIKNIEVHINGYSKTMNPETRTLDIGRSIASQILAAQKGWK